MEQEVAGPTPLIAGKPDTRRTSGILQNPRTYSFSYSPNPARSQIIFYMFWSNPASPIAVLARNRLQIRLYMAAGGPV